MILFFLFPSAHGGLSEGERESRMLCSDAPSATLIKSGNLTQNILMRSRLLDLDTRATERFSGDICVLAAESEGKKGRNPIDHVTFRVG